MDWLRNTFQVGVKDYCVYWFRLAHERLPVGGRAGLVGTNSIAEGKNREAALDYLASNEGVITDAVSSQDWPGEAAVHVSIVNWIKEPAQRPQRFTLDGAEVDGIATSLRPTSLDVRGSPLAANAGHQFFGVVQSGEGFILNSEEAQALLARSDADYTQVVRPFLVGDDITKNPALVPRRSIIDFGEMPLEVAMKWPGALDIVRDRVKPSRDRHKKRREREEWWKFSRTVRELFSAVAALPRFIACPATAKRIHMIWCEPNWTPSNAVSAFAFSDDYSMGILSSTIHTRWATLQSTRLETRPRYTVASFATFPWPEPADAHQTRVAEAAADLMTLRAEICAQQQVGLTVLYNQLEDGAWADFRELHHRLDDAVCETYGWPVGTWRDLDESNARLLELNREIIAGERRYGPFPRRSRTPS